MTPAATARRLAAASRKRLSRAADVVRRVIGVPDYERYVAHVRENHPGCTPVPRDEFVRERLADRYSRPGARCC